MNILDYKNFFLVGIKGVAMTSMAQLLVDAKKSVSGSDVEENFVTKNILKKIDVNIFTGFEDEIPEDIDCVIYTAAHKGKYNPQVIKAKENNIATYSHAEAQADLFNQKKGIAVCGVGGKSTVSAMITWILEKTNKNPSYAVGVGNIPGLNRTARWRADSDFFVAEADEYVVDPSAPSRNETIIPRFSFLLPYTTVCTNLKFDHPDVYKNFDHTKQVFYEFFNQIHKEGYLILNYKDLEHKPTTSAKNIITFGDKKEADFVYDMSEKKQEPGKNVATLIYQNNKYEINLKIPGKYNIENSVAAIAGCFSIGVPIADSISALESFNSTQRRFELVGNINNVVYYDDYAHHPNEVKSVILALNSWYPNQKKIIAFQPHTYSRTKQLLNDFIDSFGSIDDLTEIILVDIFASAREGLDESISSDDIVNGVKNKFPQIKISNQKTLSSLQNYFEENKAKVDVVLTIGAGDIYKVHSTYFKLKNKFPKLDFKEEYKLAKHTTVKIGGPAEVFYDCKNSQEFADLISFSIKNKIETTILGWGANTLISDNGIRGLVIKNSALDIKIIDEKPEPTKNQEITKILPRLDSDKTKGSFKYEFSDLDYDESQYPSVLVEMDAGVPLNFAINTLIEKGITGLQWYSRIPATIGGAIYNNIHGGTHFISEVIKSVKVIDQNGNIKNLQNIDLKAGYDVSRFHTSKEIIISAVLRLKFGNKEKAKEVAIEWATRKSVQPQKSLGCVFQNISASDKEKLSLPTSSVGYIIEHILHKKNFQIGEAKVSDRHAAFIENLGNANSHDYLEIIRLIIKETKEKTGIQLKPEIFFLGFDDVELMGITK